jgi:hypothetical protein
MSSPPSIPLPRPSVVDSVAASEGHAAESNPDTTPAEELSDAPIRVAAGVGADRPLRDSQVGVAIANAPGSHFPADTTDRLMKLAELWDRGVLSNDEFAAQRAKLLA